MAAVMLTGYHFAHAIDKTSQILIQQQEKPLKSVRRCLYRRGHRFQTVVMHVRQLSLELNLNIAARIVSAETGVDVGEITTEQRPQITKPSGTPA